MAKKTAQPFRKVNAWGYKATPSEINDSKSQTVAGEAMTVKQLFQRAALQGSFPIEAGPEYFHDVKDIQDINRFYRQGLDLVDIQDHIEHVEALQIEVQQRAKDKAQRDEKRRENALKEAAIAEHEAKQKEQQEKQ